MTPKPLVSIVVATYNGELYIEEQLLSLLKQSYTNYEIIIADDLSSDNTFTILQRYQEQYPNITIYQNKQRLGVVKNFEKLIQNATGEYIALSDQDDIWHTDKLSQAIRALESYKDTNKPLLFHSDLEVVDAQNRLLHPSYFKMRGYTFSKERSLDSMLGRSGTMGNSMVFNQKLKEEILPFPNALVVHDYWIGLVNELLGQRISTDKALVRYRIHHDNTANSLQALNQPKTLKTLRFPYHNTQREVVLQELLQRFNIHQKDQKVIKAFMHYLNFDKNKFYTVYIILKYNFFRLGILYKLKLIGAILWKHP